MFEFIEFWEREIEGKLHTVRFAHRKLLSPTDWQQIVGEFRIH